MTDKKTEKRIVKLEDNQDKVMLENRELDQRVEKLEGGKEHGK